MARPECATIRPMAAADAGEAARLAGELGYVSDPLAVAARFAALAASTDAVLVAENGGGGLSGWIHVARDATLTHEPAAEIRGLVVDAASRRRGVGRALVAAAEAWARERGLARVRVRTRVTRTEAHAFYVECGYTLEKTQEVFEKRLQR